MINTHTFKTWPFVVLVVTNLAAWLATTGSTVHSRDAYVFTALSAGLYALARGFAKQNSDTGNFWNTSEFYVTLIGAAIAIVGKLDGHVSAALVKELLAALTGLSMIARGIALAPQTQVPPTIGG